MIKYQKTIQFSVGVLIMVAISFPNIAQMSPIQYGGAGCGGVGAKTGAGIKTSAAGAHCDWCACWCGHVEYCKPPWLTPKVTMPMDWLSDGKLCSCPTAGGSKSSSQTQQQQQQQQTPTRSTTSTTRPTNSQLQRSASNTANRANANRWDCSRFTEQYRIDNGGIDPGRTTVDMYDAGEAWEPGDALNQGDILVTEGGGPNGMHAVTCYNAGCSLIIHKAGVSASVKIVPFSGYWQSRVLAVMPFK